MDGLTSVTAAAVVGEVSAMNVGAGMRACRTTGSTISVPASAESTGASEPAPKS